MKHVYVATKFERKDEARAVMFKLVQEGFKITKDWTQSVNDSQKEADEDLEGVKRADVILVLADKEAVYKGTIFEMGYANALNIPIIVVGDALDKMIFMKCEGVTKVESVTEAIELMKKS